MRLVILDCSNFPCGRTHETTQVKVEAKSIEDALRLHPQCWKCGYPLGIPVVGFGGLVGLGILGDGCVGGVGLGVLGPLGGKG